MARSQSRFYVVLGFIAAIGVALIAFVATREEPTSTLNSALDSGSAASGELIGMDVGVSKGAEDAPVILEEYADFQCPYCGMVAQLTMPTVVERYVQTGKVRIVFFDFPVHAGETSFLAAEAARCAGEQGAFWAMHDVLFSRMSEWASHRNPRGKFGEYAESLGLDGKALQECVDSRKYRELVLANRTRGQQHAVSSTPTFFVNGRRIDGAVGSDQLAEIIEEELAKASS